MEDNSKSGQVQHKIKETEKLATKERHTALKIKQWVQKMRR